MITLYNVLGVKDNATLEEIKASYRKLSLIYHPDVTGGNSEMYLKIQNAYNTFPILKRGWNMICAYID